MQKLVCILATPSTCSVPLDKATFNYERGLVSTSGKEELD